MSFLLIFLTSLIHAGLADDVNSIPINRLSKIEIESPRGWKAEFRLDGSAKLSYGANPTDFATAPKGSFSVETIYKQIFPYLRNGHDRESYAVFLIPSGQHFVSAVYLNDQFTNKKSRSDIRDNATPFDTKRFGALIKKAPIVPSDSGA
jgi:hypothetical protein